MSSELDVVIVGAGAAGIAAGRELLRRGLRIQLVEANDRIGGRAWTIQHAGMPIDLGCAWLHSADRNPWTALAPTLGFGLDRTPPPWGKQFLERGFSAAEQRAARDALATFEARLRDAMSRTDRAADLLIDGGPWNPYLEALSTYVNGAELETLSIRDYLAYVAADTGKNWRVVKGYGALVAAAAAELPITLGAAVNAVTADGRLLSVATTSGTLKATSVIITVPTNLLASGMIRLPAELDDRIEAACRLPLGLADKVIFEIDGAEELEPDTQVIGNPHRAKTGSYHLRPFGRPLIEGFLGGAAARELEAEKDMVAFAVEELTQLFGAGIKQRLKPVAQTCWARQPFSRGSYSHALPGHAGVRAILATPWEDRIYFAGEACSKDDFSTAHGAYATGVAAAHAILARQK